MIFIIEVAIALYFHAVAFVITRLLSTSAPSVISGVVALYLHTIVVVIRVLLDMFAAISTWLDTNLCKVMNTTLGLIYIPFKAFDLKNVA